MLCCLPSLLVLATAFKTVRVCAGTSVCTGAGLLEKVCGKALFLPDLRWFFGFMNVHYLIPHC